MGNYHHSIDVMQADVKAYIAKQKSIKTICADRGICRKTFYNWVKYFKRKEKYLFHKNEDAERTDRKVSQTIGRKNFMLKSAISKIVPEAIQRKLVQNIVRRFSVTKEDACDIVGFDFDKYDYKLRRPEIDDPLVVRAIQEALTINPEAPLYSCFDAILAKYPDCPSKQMKRICREYKPDLNAYRAKVKIDSQRAEKIKRRTEIVYKQSDSWVMYVQEFQLSKGVLIGEKKFTSQATIMFLFDKEIKYLLNYFVSTGGIGFGDALSFLKGCVGKNGIPKRIAYYGTRIKSKEIVDFRENISAAEFRDLAGNTYDGLSSRAKIRKKIEVDLLITPEVNFDTLKGSCENWRDYDSTK